MQIATLIIEQGQGWVKITREFNSIQKSQPVRRTHMYLFSGLLDHNDDVLNSFRSTGEGRSHGSPGTLTPCCESNYEAEEDG